MNPRAVALSGVILVLGAGAAETQDPAELRGRPVVLHNCAIRPLYDVRVPVRVAGVLEQVLVKEGSRVIKGQVLAVIDDRLARIELEKKSAAANNKAGLADAIARHKEATAQRDETEDLVKRRVESRAKLRIADAQVEIAFYGVEDAKVKEQLAQIDRKSAEAQVDMHRVLSPFDGVVVQQVGHEGESVDSLDPIFRLIRTDVVKVEGVLGVRHADRIRKGMAIEVFPDKTSAEILRFQGGHTGAVRAVKVLPDGKRCASGGMGGRIVIWNVFRGLQERVLQDHTGPVYCLATSPDDPTLLVSGGADGTLRVWDTTTGKVRHRLRTGGGTIFACVLYPDDPNFCITGHEDRNIRIWDLQAEELVAEFGKEYTSHVTSLAITPGGDQLLSAGNDQTVRVWNLENYELEETFRGRSQDVRTIGLSPDGKQFLFNSFSFLQVRRLEDGMPIEGFENQSSSFTEVAIFSPVEGLVLAATGARQLQLWQMGSPDRYQRLVRTYEGHEAPIHAVDFAPDGSYFVTGSSDRSVRAWLVPGIERIRNERKRGVLEFVNDQAEAGSQTLDLFAEVNNQDGTLKPGTFATIVVYPNASPVAAKD